MKKSIRKVPKFEPRICAYERCENEFIPYGPHHKYCSPVCKRKQTYLIDKSSNVNLKKCAWCGTLFKSEFGTKYCCDLCRQSGYKAHMNMKVVKSRGAKPRVSLEEMAKRCTAEGLSYGHYFMKYGYGDWF